MRKGSPKDYAAVPALWVEKEREGLTPERVEKQVKKEDARFPGWLEALKRLTLMGAADDSLTEIEIKMEYSTPDGKADIGAEYIKENGEWLLRDIDDRIEKTDK